MNDRNNKIVFWGCFVALITTAFAFFSRIYLCNVRFNTDFGLDATQVGELSGAGIWPFGISIILFSLIIDKVGYRVAMIFSFLCYAVYLVMACLAYAAIQGVEGAALEDAPRIACIVELGRVTADRPEAKVAEDTRVIAGKVLS